MADSFHNGPCRIVFMGTPEFAAKSLEVIHTAGHQIVGCITAPDRPAGRGQKLRSSAVKEAAQQLGIPVLQPVKLKDPEFLGELEALRAELFIVVAFRMLPEVVWKMPTMGTFNLHASLLPQYRGAAPINWALINGESKTGITTFFINEDIDTGGVLLQQEVEINQDMSAGDLHDILRDQGAQLILKTIDGLLANNLMAKPQFFNGQELKPAPKIFKQDCKIDWSKSAEEVKNKIRGLSPFPTAFTRFINDEDESFGVKILTVSIDDSVQLDVGSIKADNKNIWIGTGTQALLIQQFQPEGKKKMAPIDFLRGYRKKLIGIVQD